MKSYKKYSENVRKLVQQTTILKGPFYDTKFSEGRFFMLADFLCTNNVPHHFLWRYQSFFFGDNFQVFFSFYFRTMFRSFFHLYVFLFYFSPLSCFRYRAIITPLHEKMSKTTAKIIITFIWASSVLVIWKHQMFEVH